LEFPDGQPQLRPSIQPRPLSGVCEGCKTSQARASFYGCFVTVGGACFSFEGRTLLGKERLPCQFAGFARWEFNDLRRH
jgi:hypothetical protein